jgi:hypothetical protein
MAHHSDDDVAVGRNDVLMSFLFIPYPLSPDSFIRIWAVLVPLSSQPNAIPFLHGLFGGDART